MADECEFEAICKCAICLEVWRNPKTLNCDHAFCKDCLEDLYDPTQKPEGISCPTCRNFHPLGENDTVNSIKTNIYTKQLIDALFKRLALLKTFTHPCMHFFGQ